MSLQYTRADLKSRINAGIKNKQGILINFNDLINQTVREVNSSTDLSSTKRTVQLTPDLVGGFNRYAAPSDLKSSAIIDVFPTANRTSRQEFNLVLPEEIDRTREAYTIAVDDSDTVKTVIISAPLSNQALVVSNFESTDDWIAVGGATNLVINTDNYINSYGSLSWDIDATSSTTAGIQNVSLDNFDWTDYRNQSLYVWQYIPNKANITNFKMRIGTNTSNYIESTVTAQSDSTEIRVGWNLFRFDLSNATITGTINTETGVYLSIYMTKDTTKISQLGFLTDFAVLKKGQVHEISYYSKYGWQTSAGVYLENSTDDSDYILADTDEFEMFVHKGISLAGTEVEEYKLSEIAQERYKEKKKEYELVTPSQAKLITSTYYNF